MEAKDVIQYIRQALGPVKEQNQELVSVAALEHYLDDLEKHVDKTGTVNVAFCIKLSKSTVEKSENHSRLVGTLPTSA